MTREKAIKELEILKEDYWDDDGYGHETKQYVDTMLALDMAIKALKQEPKTGHWILTDVEGYRVWHCNCSECGKDPQDYTGGSEDWWLIKSKLPKFCPNCGAKIEVEE